MTMAWKRSPSRERRIGGAYAIKPTDRVSLPDLHQDKSCPALDITKR
jgi:hypothetical protein